jgi:hypothetical protein
MIYERRVYYKREIARTSFLLAKAYAALGSHDENRRFLSRSIGLYRIFRPEDDRKDDEISESDFNDIIAPRDR